MTQQEEKKLNNVIKYIENLQNECLEGYENAINSNSNYYFMGGYNNIYYCIEKIKKEFNIKD